MRKLTTFISRAYKGVVEIFFTTCLAFLSVAMLIALLIFLIVLLIGGFSAGIVMLLWIALDWSVYSKAEKVFSGI